MRGSLTAPIIKTTFKNVYFRAVASFLIAFAPTKALSLQYQAVPLDQESVVLTFTGPIVPGDSERLGTFIQSLPSDVNIKAIFIDSGGGNLVEASTIATFFSKIHPLVIVPSGSQCTSACFLLFAAAGQRAVAPDALIGVHSASDNGQEDINSMAFTTAMAREAAAYGVPPSIVGKMVQTGPDRVTWLDPSDLAAMHVQVIEANASGAANVPQPSFDSAPPGLLKAPAPTGVGASNSWIQIYSRALFSEAVGLGMDYRRKFPNLGIFKCDNGWYALVLGPYDPSHAVEARDQLVDSGDIPRDSLVTQGTNFQQLAWGNEANSDAGSSSSFGASIALKAATEFFRTSALSNREAMSFLDRTYAPQVMYFGKKSSKAYVMAEKQAFVDRWPQRAYSMRPGSVSTSCDQGDGSCTVSGIVDWRASSAERNATSTGSARFQLTFSTQAGSPTLLSEWSEVLTRNSRAGP